ncbi:Glycosyl transferase, family 14 and Chromatin SPT2 family-containing protein [Strongyloides ratti]|uniref:Glycosyl transferase, family 14 and Chromatin SPT2 family-containing protein n=1 Tax=Strongyloides ratti TaxID=34506 RepID=A0A090KWY6_STRRB|nr:Glycosyl transferase, family 14 and Chromatin SPT2 family-containing protein [Strongyloides ratti]CEF61941.1 Glycosyl transferase, family 14 and Chromatin SPT2 family-containing protein [Strongyloides ratti]
MIEKINIKASLFHFFNNISPKAFTFFIITFGIYCVYLSIQTINIIYYQKNNNYLSVEKNILSMWKPKDFNLNCTKLLNGDEQYIKNLINKRYTNKNLSNMLDLSCDGIRSRGFYPSEPLSDIEANYPIAYARNVYNDYYMIELQFLLSYAPQNHYCFAVDDKAKLFRKQLENLEKCFDNVYITNVSYIMTSFGQNQTYSSYECMKYLIKKKWKYLFILQNDDFPLKTNYELIQILSARNSTMDISYVNPKHLIRRRIDLSKKWDHKSLNFKKDVNVTFDDRLLNENMTFQKGYSAHGLPRESVEYLVNSINLTTYFKNINTGRFGEDEMVWQTLFNDEYVKVPQWVHKNCVSQYYNEKTYMVREAFWYRRNCKSNMLIHSVCIVGMEMLNDLIYNPHYFINKFKSNNDIGAAICLGEYIYNKTYFNKINNINLTFYINLPQTKYQNADKKTKDEIIKNCKNNSLWSFYYWYFFLCKVMDEFFADILGDAKVTSKNLNITNRRIVSDDFKNREKFYTSFTNKGKNLYKNNIGIQNKVNQITGKNKINCFTLNSTLKNDKSTQGQNLSFSQIFNIAKLNEKVSDSRSQKNVLKNKSHIEQPTNNVIPPIQKPKIPKLIIRKTDYTIRNKDYDIPREAEYSKKLKLSKTIDKKISSEKGILQKIKDKFPPSDKKRKVEIKRHSSSNITKIAKIPQKFSCYTREKERSHFKNSRCLQNYNRESSEDSNDSMDNFIDDSNDDLPPRTEVEEALKSISRYDKKRWLENERSIKEDKMVSSFSDIKREERRSLKLALKEDLRELKKGSHAL